MKLTELQKLIREEVRIQLKEILDPKTLAKDILDVFEKIGVYNEPTFGEDHIKTLASNEFLQDYEIKEIITDIIEKYK